MHRYTQLTLITNIAGFSGEKINLFFFMFVSIIPISKCFWISLPFALIMVLKPTNPINHCLVFLKIKKSAKFSLFSAYKKNKKLRDLA